MAGDQAGSNGGAPSPSTGSAMETRPLSDPPRQGRHGHRRRPDPADGVELPFLLPPLVPGQGQAAAAASGCSTRPPPSSGPWSLPSLLQRQGHKREQQKEDKRIDHPGGAQR